MLWSQYGAIDGPVSHCRSICFDGLYWWKWAEWPFLLDEPGSVLPSLMPDDHLILILFPSVILTSVTGGGVLSALLAFNWQLLHFYSTHTTTFAWGDCLYRCCQQPSKSRLLSLNSANRKRAPSRPVPWRYCQTSQKSITVKISSSSPSEGGVYSLLPVQSTT